jgi:hypothetical protein
MCFDSFPTQNVVYFSRFCSTSRYVRTGKSRSCLSVFCNSLVRTRLGAEYKLPSSALFIFALVDLYICGVSSSDLLFIHTSRYLLSNILVPPLKRRHIKLLSCSKWRQTFRLVLMPPSYRLSHARNSSALLCRWQPCNPRNASIYQTTQPNIPVYSNFQQNRCEKLNSYKWSFF